MFTRDLSYATTVAARRPRRQVADAPLSEARQAAVDRVLSDSVPADCRRRIGTILAPLPDPLLHRLGDFGLKIDIEEPDVEAPSKKVRVLGVYQPLSQHIAFSREVLFSDQGRHTVLHEVWHAIDHMEGIRQGRPAFTAPYASEHDKELRALYNKYSAQCNVENLDSVRATVRHNFGNTPRAQFNLKDDWGVRHVDFAQQGDKEIYRLSNADEPDARLNRQLGNLAVISGGLIGGCVGCMLVPMAPVVGATVGALAGMSAGWIGKKLGEMRLARREREQTSRVEVAMAHGQHAEVTQGPGQTTIVVPQGARSFDSHQWSTYAWRAGDVREYEAEGASAYLGGGMQKRILEVADPGLYDHVERRVAEEFQRSA
jgi:hypothetical protein